MSSCLKNPKKSMKKIAIIVAMQSEFNLVSNILEHAETREIEGAKALVG